MNNEPFLTLSEGEAMEIDGGLFGIALTVGAKIAIGCGLAGVGIGLFAAYRCR